MPLSVYLEPSEIEAPQLYITEFSYAEPTDDTPAELSYEDTTYSPERVPEDDAAETEQAADAERERAWFNKLPKPTLAEVRADEAIAAREESETTVERLYCAQNSSPTTVFDFCFLTAHTEPRSRNNGKWQDYQIDCYLAARRALSGDLRLWFLFVRLYVDGLYSKCAPARLGSSVDVQTIKILVGNALLAAGLQSMGAYFATRRGYNQRSRKATRL
jgi:hypothetical protein